MKLKSIYFNCLWAFLLTTFVVSCTTDEEEMMGNISGIVTDAGAGTTPLLGVRVSIVSSGKSTNTGTDGQYSFSDIEPGSYTLQFIKQGYITSTRRIEVLAGERVSGDMQLEAETESSNIKFNTQALDFGTSQNQLSLVFENKGNVSAQWNINLGANPWLMASASAGSIAAHKTQTIVFTVDRDRLFEATSAIITVNADGNSYPITVTCAPEGFKSELSVTPTTLNFGTDYSEMNITVRNTGNKNLNWMLSGITESCITVAQENGTIIAGGTNVIKVFLNRKMMPQMLQTSFILTDGIKQYPISVLATQEAQPDTTAVSIVAKDGLYAFYQFNNNFNDSYENAINGMRVGNLSFVSGVTNYSSAIKFSRTEPCSFVVPEPLIDTNRFSVSFWAKKLSDGTIFHVESKDGNPTLALSMDNGFLKFISTAYNLKYNYAERPSFTHSSLADDNWHHIVVKSEYVEYNATITLYIDGVKVDAVTERFSGSEIPYYKGSKFILGGSLTNVVSTLGPTNMMIDNLRIYDTRSITDAQISTIYQAKQ